MTHPSHTPKDEKAQARRPTDAAAMTEDMERRPGQEARFVETPDVRLVEPLPEHEKHDQLADQERNAESRQEALLDEAIEETFPGSDPISPKHIT